MSARERRSRPGHLHPFLGNRNDLKHPGFHRYPLVWEPTGFEALIAADTDDSHQRSYGSLGWALKDKPDPEWQRASDELSRAIAIRDRLKISGWRLYEANRAICSVELLASLAPADPKATTLRALINQDIQAALTDPYAKPMVEANATLQGWITRPPE